MVPAVVVLGIVATFLVHRAPDDHEASLAAEDTPEALTDVFVRAVKVYIFVMALIFLGAGFKPLIDAYIIQLPSQVLFWVNLISRSPRQCDARSRGDLRRRAMRSSFERSLRTVDRPRNAYPGQHPKHHRRSYAAD